MAMCIEKHNGVLVADVDGLTGIEIARYLNELKKDKLVFGAGKSLSGSGLRIFCKLYPKPTTELEHDAGYYAFVSHLEKKHGILCDMEFAGKPNSLLYFSRDDMRFFHHECDKLILTKSCLERVTKGLHERAQIPVGIDVDMTGWRDVGVYVLEQERFEKTFDFKIRKGWRNMSAVAFAKGCKQCGFSLSKAQKSILEFSQKYMEEGREERCEKGLLSVVNSVYKNSKYRSGGGLHSFHDRDIPMGYQSIV